jgi:dihydropteroate synthase
MLPSLNLRGHCFVWGKKTYIMGILNVTPDSFSDGGEFHSLDHALKQAERMITWGADLIDIGGQSTRPGAKEISLEEELNRVIPVIEKIRQETYIPISIDTTKAAVAKAAVEAGADLVNDISGATFDPEMLSMVAQLEVPLILMHIRGNSQTMQQLTAYQNLVGEIKDFLTERLDLAMKMGIPKSHLIIDPGIGFAKTKEQNLALIRRLPEFRSLDVPLLLGVSRKSFIGQILQQNDPKQRIWGTAAACAYAIAQGVDLLRVHDVKEMAEVCRVADAIHRQSSTFSSYK